MAEELSAYDFNPPDPNSKYPWNTWCNGSIWKVQYGVDYTSRADSFVRTLRREAYKRDLDLRFRVEARSIMFQFIPSRESAEFVNQSADPEVKDI